MLRCKGPFPPPQTSALKWLFWVLSSEPLRPCYVIGVQMLAVRHWKKLDQISLFWLSTIGVLITKLNKIGTCRNLVWECRISFKSMKHPPFCGWLGFVNLDQTKKNAPFFLHSVDHSWMRPRCADREYLPTWMAQFSAKCRQTSSRHSAHVGWFPAVSPVQKNTCRAFWLAIFGPVPINIQQRLEGCTRPMARGMSLDSESLTMVAASSPKRDESKRAVATAECIRPRVAATDTPLSKSVSRSFGCDRETCPLKSWVVQNQIANIWKDLEGWKKS